MRRDSADEGENRFKRCLPGTIRTKSPNEPAPPASASIHLHLGGTRPPVIAGEALSAIVRL